MVYHALYIWQHADWPNFSFSLEKLSPLLQQVHFNQGILLGRVQELGVHVQEQLCLHALGEDVVKSSAIEGEYLNVQSVRSSLARRLGVDIGTLAPVDRHVEGIVEMALDATQQYTQPLSQERLYAWHAALFPTAYSGLQKILVAQYRDDSQGPMQVVSLTKNQQHIHFQAPPAECLVEQMKRFLHWLNNDNESNPFIKAGIAHLWFLTLHPFDYGNGRIGRAIIDYFLARADNLGQRYYSMSAQIQANRSSYYETLELTQKEGMDITQWLLWFLNTLAQAMQKAIDSLDEIHSKTQFWQRNSGRVLNERQIKVINRLLDGFEGKLNNRKWVAIANCSRDTALRDINDLVEKGILSKAQGGGRSVSYELIL